MNDRSPLAKQHKRTVPLRPRKSSLFGVCMHTTGTGILDKKPDPLTFVLSLYRSQSECGHYVIARSGDIHQVAGEDERAWHAGLAQPANAVDLYKSGQWAKVLSPAVVSRWQLRWPGCKSPLDIFGGGSPNDLYLGIELEAGADRTFTPAQYKSSVELLNDISERRKLTLSGRRLVGHEDLHPLKRWDVNGGWDPGALRETPRFHWDQITPFLKSNKGNYNAV